MSFTVTIGPAKPQYKGKNGRQLFDGDAIVYWLARTASKFAPTTIIDKDGAAIWTSASHGDNVELF